MQYVTFQGGEYLTFYFSVIWRADILRVSCTWEKQESSAKYISSLYSLEGNLWFI